MSAPAPHYDDLTTIGRRDVGGSIWSQNDFVSTPEIRTVSFYWASIFFFGARAALGLFWLFVGRCWLIIFGAPDVLLLLLSELSVIRL